MFYGNLVQLGKKSNSVIRSRSVMVKNWCNVLSMEGVTVCGHRPECRVTFLHFTCLSFKLPFIFVRVSSEFPSNVIEDILTFSLSRC